MAAAPGAAAAINLGPMTAAIQQLVHYSDITTSMQKVQYYASGINKSDGTVPSEFRAWLQAVDLIVPQGPAAMVIEAAALTSTGTLNQEVEHFIQTAVAAMPAGPPAPTRTMVPWANLRAHLQAAFLSQNEDENLKLELERVQKAAYQTVPQFNVDFRAKALRAYPIPWNAETNRILVRAYIRALKDRRLSSKVLEAQPVDLPAAMARADHVSAVDEQRTQLLGPEPMDTSALGYGQQIPQAIPKTMTTDQKLDKLIELLTLQSTQPQQRPFAPSTGGPKRKFEFTPDGKPICTGCAKVGHVWRDCRSRKTGPPAKPSQTKN